MNEEKNFYDSNYDVCDFSLCGDYELNTDESDNERNRELSKKHEALEIEFIVWKMDNWQLFLENNWYGEIELWYQFNLYKESLN